MRVSAIPYCDLNYNYKVILKLGYVSIFNISHAQKMYGTLLRTGLTLT